MKKIASTLVIIGLSTLPTFAGEVTYDGIACTDFDAAHTTAIIVADMLEVPAEVTAATLSLDLPEQCNIKENVSSEMIKKALFVHKNQTENVGLTQLETGGYFVFVDIPF
ncbi:MAG: hypothetical protein AAGF25_00500 [Pseudomonadota bacterium]